jgi:hypothetical protein
MASPRNISGKTNNPEQAKPRIVLKVLGDRYELMNLMTVAAKKSWAVTWRTIMAEHINTSAWNTISLPYFLAIPRDTGMKANAKMVTLICMIAFWDSGLYSEPKSRKDLSCIPSTYLVHRGVLVPTRVSKLELLVSPIESQIGVKILLKKAKPKLSIHVIRHE